MRKISLVFLVFAISYAANAQNRFELDINTKVGYYFPVNKSHIPEKYFPDNTFAPSVGLSFGHIFSKSTMFLLGIEYSYLSPEMDDFFDNELDVNWQTLNIPFNIEQRVGKNFFLTGGVTLLRQLKVYDKDAAANAIQSPQEIPEYNWQVGAGYIIKDFRISMQYTQGFKTIGKSTSTGHNSWYNVNVVHQEVFIKIEYPLWKF